MMYMISTDKNYLVHHGIKGQKWGVRRYQNEDGSLTPEGKKRYGYNEVTGEMTEKGMGRRYGDALSAVKKQYKSEKRNLEEELWTAAKRDEVQYYNGNDEPQNMNKLIQEYQDRIRDAYGKKDVSDEEIKLAAAKYAKGQATTSLTLGIIGGTLIASSGAVGAGIGIKNIENKEAGTLMTLSALSIGAGAIPIAVGASSYSSANKEYKRAKKAYYDKDKPID